METAEETVTTETPTLPPAVHDETILHVAHCRTCEAGAKYQMTASGAGIIVHERYGVPVDTSIGIGERGLPLCPNGHGEMELRDEQLPAGEAIERVREQLAGGAMEPLQGTLPGIVPAFNYQGAYMELEGMAVEVDRLEREYDDAASIAKDAKKAWDKAEEVYTKMALEFRRRRREKVASGEPVTDLDESRCTYEQLNPDNDCPLCDGSIVDVEEIAIAPKNSAEHAEQAAAMLVSREVADLRDLLAAAQMSIPEATVREWSTDERAAVSNYADAIATNAEPIPPRPSVLGTNHVASPVKAEADQTCTQCDTVLVPFKEDEEPAYFDGGTLVGTDCPGKPREEHRYPKGRHSKKKK